jgi:nicotinamide mononucleotide transporter
MSLTQVWQAFVTGLKQTTPLEYAGVFTGIGSVFFSRIANVWLYPVGIISTVIYTYLSFAGGLYAEGGLNVYYTIMSLVGWYMWEKRKSTGEKELEITKSTSNDWLMGLGFFIVMLVVFFYILKSYTNSTVPLADSFASAAAYTGMLLMNKKKIEHWLWWIITNIISIPLYFIKGYVFTSVQFVVLLILAISGWMVWDKKLKANRANA